MMKKQESKTVIELHDLKISQITVTINGLTPLIVHNFSAKSSRQILEKQQGKAKNAKHEIRKPEEECEAAKHISIDGWEGFPVGGLKKCLVRGGKAVGLVMTDLRSAVFVEADCKTKNLFRINGKSKMGEDPIRLPNGAIDLRYRPYYNEWSANLKITFNEGLVSKDQLLQALYAGGFGVGLGDWRPEKGGDFGRFSVQGM